LCQLEPIYDNPTYRELAHESRMWDGEYVSEHQRYVRSAYGLIPAKAHPYSLVDVKRWREVEYDAGRPSSLADFFAAHAICSTCGGEGVHMIGWRDANGADEVRAAEELSLEQLPFYDVCPQCGGSGTSAKE